MIASDARHPAKRPRSLRALAAAVGLAAAAIVLACEPSDAPREIAEAQEPMPVAPAPAAQPPALPEPPSAPAEQPEARSTSAEVARQPAAPRTAPERPAPTPAAEPRVEAAALDPLAPSHPPLDILLQAPRESAPSSRPIDLDAAAPAAAEDEAGAPGTLDRWANHLWLERRSDLLGPNGREGMLWETDAGVRIPVDKSVSLEGGVRVDQREQPGAQEPERRSTPRVGVEVRF